MSIERYRNPDGSLVIVERTLIEQQRLPNGLTIQHETPPNPPMFPAPQPGPAYVDPLLPVTIERR